MDEKQLLSALSDLMDSKLKTALEPIRQDISGIQQDLSEVKERVTKIEVVQENITNRNIQLLFEGQQGINSKFQKLDRMEMTLNDVKSDTEVVKSVVTQHSQSIRELKEAR